MCEAKIKLQLSEPQVKKDRQCDFEQNQTTIYAI